MNIFADITGKKTLRFNELFKIIISPEKIIDNEGCTKHICTVEVHTSYKMSIALKELLGTDFHKTFRGTATLKPGDNKKDLVGKDIAEHKALAKAYNYINKRLVKLNKDLENYKTNIIPLYQNKAEAKYNNQNNCILKMANK